MERTWIMRVMSVTLVVLNTIGWLNTDASCRGGGGQPRGASSLQERARLQIGGRGHGEERTQNMESMFVTLEVSKLSGWLNADAP